MATQAEVRDLIAKVRQRGYKVTKSGTKHYKVLQANGAIVKDDNGPMIISATPSDANWRDMAVQRMRRVGIFDGDPYAPTRGKKGPSGEGEPQNGRSAPDERKERERQAVSRAARRTGDNNRERSRALRYRIETMVVKFGGWSIVRGGSTSTRGVTVADFMRSCREWDDARPEHLWPLDPGKGPATMSAANQTLSILRKPDTTIGARWAPLLEGFMDELYGDGDAADAALRLAERIAASKGEKVSETFRRSTIGIPAEPGAGAAELPEPEPIEPDWNEIVLPVALPAFPLGVEDLPDLAFRTLYYMARGHVESSLNEREDLIRMAKEIAVLELKGRDE